MERLIHCKINHDNLCHSEQSEESLEKKEILHFVQDDIIYVTAY